MWWDKTIARWHSEGLPPQMTDVFEISQYFQHDPYKQFWFSTTHATIDAVQHHVEGTVEDMDGYLRALPRLYPDHRAMIETIRPWAQKQSRGEVVLWITLEGFFWFPRTLMNIERLTYGYYDQPELIHRINRDLLHFNLDLLERLAAASCVPTFMTLAEDMSYNHGPMISQAHFQQFLEPYYLPLMARAHELGILTIVDTDGDPTLMIPWLNAAGIDGVLPLERQAGVDAMKLRQAFPKLRMIGHFDKMTMTRGEHAMRQEFERLKPVMLTGGFVPSVDHQTPPGVSIDEYRLYLRLLWEYTQLS